MLPALIVAGVVGAAGAWLSYKLGYTKGRIDGMRYALDKIVDIADNKK